MQVAEEEGRDNNATRVQQILRSDAKGILGVGDVVDRPLAFRRSLVVQPATVLCIDC